MNLFKTALLASVATVAFAGAAFAADPILPPPADIYIPEVGGMDWSGFYAGANVGYGWGMIDLDDDEDFSDEDIDLDGFIAGVQVGANAQFDSIVVGIEGDLAWTGLGDSDEDVDFADVNWIGTIRGRLGFAAENFLIYGTAGVAFAGVDGAIANEVDEDLYYSDDVRTGWVAGVGAEMMVTDAISIKGEYLYHDFGDMTWSSDDDSIGSDFNVQTVKVGLNFHF